jgi:ABC-type phosphate transport system substrate-binding protein
MNTQFYRALLQTTSLAALVAGTTTIAGAQDLAAPDDVTPAVTTEIRGGGATLPEPTYRQEFSAFSKLTGGAFKFTYAGSGSGGGQAGFLNNDCTFGGFQTCTHSFTVDFGASDAFLAASQVAGYTLAKQDGPLIQIPKIGVGITLPFRNSKLTKGTQLQLTDSQICGVFSGALNNWSQVSSKAAPGPITVVYRADSSGTTFLFTQHLAAVCNASQFSGTLAATKTFTTLFAGGTPPANFTGSSQSSGVAATLLASNSAIGYLSPDYTSIALKSPNTTSLIVASVVNSSNSVAYQPTTGNITTGLANPGAGSTNAQPPATKAAAANPLNWIPSIPTTTSGYSIVGYTTWEVSTCYAHPDVKSGLIKFLKDEFHNTMFKTIAENNGFVPVANSAASRYVTAIDNDFLSNASHFNLNIGNTTACNGKPGR